MLDLVTTFRFTCKTSRERILPGDTFLQSNGGLVGIGAGGVSAISLLFVLVTYFLMILRRVLLQNSRVNLF